MIQKIKNAFLAFSTFLLISLGGFVAAPAVMAACQAGSTDAACQQQQINSNLCNGSNFDLSGNPAKGNSTADCASGTSSLSDKIKSILNILSAVIGIVAVIMIIYAGFRYVTSAGSEGGVKAAKNAIIYAIIGLVVVALAQVIVHFVITNVAG